MPVRGSSYVDRRGTSLLPRRDPLFERRTKEERRRRSYTIPFPDRRLTRSAYEGVFLKLVSGSRLRLAGWAVLIAATMSAHLRTASSRTRLSETR